MADLFLSVNRNCSYGGVEYHVVCILDNDLLLCVVKEDLEKGKFPLNTVVIPDKQTES